MNVEAELARIETGVRGLIKRMESRDDDPEINNTRVHTWLVVGILNWEDGDDEEREAPVIWCEGRGSAIKLGILRAAEIELESLYNP